MKSHDLESKLTPAARQALDESLADYREQVLRLAEAHAAKLTGEAREIAVNDIIATYDVFRRHRFLGAGLNRVERAARLYAVGGAVMIFLGLSYYAVSSVLSATSLVDQLPLLFTLVGATFSVVGLVFMYFYRQQAAFSAAEVKPAEMYDDILFLNKWRAIELAVRDVVAQSFGESVADANFMELTKRLDDVGILNNEQRRSLVDLLRVRNEIVHRPAGGQSAATPPVMRAADDLLRTLLGAANRAARHGR